MSMLVNSLTSLLSVTGQIKIVQVGANDGVIGDPVYKFVNNFPNKTQIVLIEPQPFVVPILKKNYRFHPNHQIVEKAVGPAGTMVLYSVDPAIWPALNVPYAEDWPIYRAPTGITSSSKEHVRKWLAKFYQSNDDLDAAIIEIPVESLPLSDILGSDSSIDVLVVDAEGADDQIIYDSVTDGLLPRIIHFESAHLNHERLSSVTSYLEEFGYFVHRGGINITATALDLPQAVNQ